MSLVNVVFWVDDISGLVKQRYSRMVEYDNYSAFTTLVNKIRKEIYPGKTLDCGPHEYPDKKIHVAYIDINTGKEYKNREFKNMHQLDIRRYNIKSKKPISQEKPTEFGEYLQSELNKKAING